MQGVVWPWMLIAVYNQIQVRYIQRGSFRTAAPSLLLRVNSEARVGRRVSLNSSNPHSLSTRFELATLASGADSNWPSTAFQLSGFAEKAITVTMTPLHLCSNLAAAKLPRAEFLLSTAGQTPLRGASDARWWDTQQPTGTQGSPSLTRGQTSLCCLRRQARQGGPFKGPRKVVETGPQPPPAAVQHPIPSTQHAPAIHLQYAVNQQCTAHPSSTRHFSSTTGWKRKRS